MNENIFKVVIGTWNGTVYVYNEYLSQVKSFPAHTDAINRIKQSPFNNNYVTTVSSDSSVKIWNSNDNWNLVRTYNSHRNFVLALEYVDKDLIATGSGDETIKIWSISTGATIRTINSSAGNGFCSLQLLSNPLYLASGMCRSGEIRIYDVTTGNLTFTLGGHSSAVNDLSLISNNLLASSSDDFSIRIWDLANKEAKFILDGHSNCVFGLKLISFDILMSGSWDFTIKLWNITSGTLITNLTGHANRVQWSVDVLDDEQTLVSGSHDQTIKLWNVASGESLNSVNIGLDTRLNNDNTDLNIGSLTVLKAASPSNEKSIKILYI